MRKGIVCLAATLVLIGSLQTQGAVYFSPDQTLISSMSKTWDAANTTSEIPTKELIDGAVRFSAKLQYGDGTGDGWAAQGIGYQWPPPAALQDLSGYDGYALSFLNTNNSFWFVNLYINTGWTDPPYNEEDNFYENGWVELLPGVSTTIILDFADLGVAHLNHVSNIGFQVGGNMDEFPSYSPDNPSNPDTYHIDVTPIPEPVMLVLLSLGGMMIRLKK